MKKIFLIGTLLIFGWSSAQIEFENTRFGLTAGPNYSGVKNAHNPSSKRWGFMAGVLAEIPWTIGGSEDQFYIQPEVMYMAAGENGRKSLNQVYQANYISVPVWFKGYFSEAESEFFGMIGPRFGFLLNQKVENPQRPGYSPDGYGKAASFDLAIAAGLGFSYKREWELSLRYDLGVTNAYPEMDKDFNPSGDPRALKKKHQHVISVGLSYIFE